MPISLLPPGSQAEFPRRVVCLTGEATETLHLLGEPDRIAGAGLYRCRVC